MRSALSPPVLLLVLFLLNGGRAHAFVTAAWKCAIAEMAPDLQSNPTFSKLDKPPGESPFIQPGDDLWDVSKILHWQEEPGDLGPQQPPVERTNWQGDWIVWNARTREIVASGSWADLFAVNDVIHGKQEESHVRCTFELIDARETKLPPAVIFARVGDETTSGADGLNVRCTSYESAGTDTFMATVSWQQPGSSQTWTVESQAYVPDGKRTLIAQYGAGPTAWKLYLTAEAELADGTPSMGATTVDSGDGVKPWPGGMKRNHTQRFDLDDGRSVNYLRLESAIQETFTGGDPRKEITAPAEMKKWLQGTFVDLSNKIRTALSEERVPDEPFAYYDPRTSILITIGSTEDLDHFEAIAAGLVCRFEQSLWVENNPASGGWGLLMEPGCGGLITRRDDVGENLTFNIEANATNIGLDLRFVASVIDQGNPVGLIRSTASLPPGKTTTLATCTGSSGREIPVELICRPFDASPR